MTESFEPENNEEGMEVDERTQPIIFSYPLDIFSDLQLANGRFSRQGLSWFAQTFFLKDQARTPEKLVLTLKGYSSLAFDILSKSVLAEGLDICTEEGINELNNRCLTANKDSSEWWASQLINEINCLVNNPQLEEKEIQNALWRMNRLSNFYFLLIFKEVIEPTFWSGYLVNHLKDILKIWHDNQENDEKFWQKVFQDNSIILSQVFSFPVIFIEREAYVGGKSINNKGGNVVDFLLKNNLTKNTALVEIKTPKTQLIGPQYRSSIYSISTEITGSIVQISNYKDSLIKNYHNLVANEEEINAFNPPCMVIAGNSQAELTDQGRIKSFELFRNGLKDVQLVTYDELFHKIEILINLIEGKN